MAGNRDDPGLEVILLGYLHGDYFPAHGDDSVSENPLFDDNFTLLEFFHFATNFQFDAEWSWFEIIHME